MYISYIFNALDLNWNNEFGFVLKHLDVLYLNPLMLTAAKTA